MQVVAASVRITACVAALCLAPTAAPEETTSPAATATPEDEVRELMNYSVAVAQRILGEHPAFHPFAFVMKTDGKIGQVALSDGRNHEGAVLLTTLGEMLQTRAAEGHYRAVVITADVHIMNDGEETDAIRAGLEHTTGYCTNIYFPYERSEDGTLTLGKAVSSKREGVVFGPCDETAGH